MGNIVKREKTSSWSLARTGTRNVDLIHNQIAKRGIRVIGSLNKYGDMNFYIDKNSKLKTEADALKVIAEVVASVMGKDHNLSINQGSTVYASTNCFQTQVVGAKQ